MLVPAEPKIYHILHVDRLASIVADRCLWSDTEVRRRGIGGTTIGIGNIKQRRLTRELDSHPGLHVGDCVPFYFCPRSVMLYVISRADHPELRYRGGQGPIIHLEADLRRTVAWADANDRRWAFTLSNAAANYFEDYDDLEQLKRLDWEAIQALDWQGRQEGKQAEFLVEGSFPWETVSRVGAHSPRIANRVLQAIQGYSHRPPVEIKPGWYY